MTYTENPKTKSDYKTLVYIAGPYRASTEWGIKQNIRSAEAVALKYWKLGYAVICPHKNTSFLGGTLPDSAWLKGDLAILARCDVIVMAPGWIDSEGARAELRFAELHDLEVIYETNYPYESQIQENDDH